MPDKPEAQAEEELLSLLAALNTQRAAEEAQGHICWLRPDFQTPNASTAQQQTDTKLTRRFRVTDPIG